MRVSCLQENLAKGLSIVARAVATRSTLPVLGNINLGYMLSALIGILVVGVVVWLFTLLLTSRPPAKRKINQDAVDHHS